MFKKMLICLMMIFAVLLTGCVNTEQNFLEYQTVGFETHANVDIDGKKYSVYIKKDTEGNASITFEEPVRLKGTTLETDGDNLYYCVGSLKLPLGNKENNKIAKLLHLFELSKDNIVSNRTDLLNGVKVNIINFKQEGGNVTLFLATETNIPIRIEANTDGNNITINFSEFKI
ncbi:MAG: hypothetical protein IKL40_04585 [Clostridia bacterium]|nr:hypothetical protein [Clostridia bacterium]